MTNSNERPRSWSAFPESHKLRGGRKRLRSSLYMAAHNARLHNPKFKENYNQLIARGKLFKVAMVAVMRKLLVIMNTMIKTDTTWNAHLIES